MKTALVIIDMLNDFVLPGAPLEVPAARKILPALQQKLAQARQDGLAVIYVCDAHAPDDREFERMGWPPHAVRGTRGAEVVDELAPRAGEPVITKTSYSGFHDTELDKTLKNMGIEELVLTGCVTSICVLYTAADAVMNGYQVTVPADCVAPLEAKDGEFALNQMRNVLGITVI